ncbi:MAG: capsular polysaccharide biosynthesis protein CapF [Clostridiales bacterium]|jgi:UDP-2-acetamido-2,6-beta-L-arabino-hexul-4-ose reductase|nr:capsular polysaccharide biosynthesis protein CapF [Clostridiales bacterium]
MKVLVTGANGFVGKNLVAHLKTREHMVFEYDINSTTDQLDKFTAECEFVFHLAGINRPKDEAEFMAGNFGFSSELLNALLRHGNTCPVLISSSIQAALDNPYGKSKKAGEDLVFEYSDRTGANCFVYRLPNLFGKWCRPNYNSVIATFCNNIIHDNEITINNPDTLLNLAYIDDICEEFSNALGGNPHKEGDYCTTPITYSVSLGLIAKLLYSFKDSRKTLAIPDMSDDFTKKLYATYLSYLPENQFSYPLKMNTDNRGSFTEILRTLDRGQLSVNVSKPGITKGNHWHHTKNEKFIVVAGDGVIRFRKIGSDDIIEYFVSGDKIEVVDIPIGFTHNIENLGDTDLVTIMWCNECFDPHKPDTTFLEV